MSLEEAHIMRGAAATIDLAAKTISGAIGDVPHTILSRFEDAVAQELRIAKVMIRVAGMQATNNNPDLQHHNEFDFLELLKEL